MRFSGIVQNQLWYIKSRADPASKFREGDFSNIWQSSLITSSLLQETSNILHNTAVTKQWTSKCQDNGRPIDFFVANAVSRIVQSYGEKTYEQVLGVDRPPPGSAHLTTSHVGLHAVASSLYRDLMWALAPLPVAVTKSSSVSFTAASFSCYNFNVLLVFNYAL